MCAQHRTAHVDVEHPPPLGRFATDERPDAPELPGIIDQYIDWTKGRFESEELRMVDELSHTLKQTSICGLGQILPAPIQSVLKYFRQEVEEHLVNRRCPAGVCFTQGASA